MGVSLSKGQKISLSKVGTDAGIAHEIKKVVAAIGWDVNGMAGGGSFDLDLSAFLCKADGKVKSEKGLIFFHHKEEAGVVHSGDNRTGEGDGDDEVIAVSLDDVDADIEKIVFVVNIYDENNVGLNFGQVSNAFIRLVDSTSGTELLKYELDEDYSTKTALVVGELYRHDGSWKFSANDSGYAGGLKEICGIYGVDVE